MSTFWELLAAAVNSTIPRLLIRQVEMLLSLIVRVTAHCLSEWRKELKHVHGSRKHKQYIQQTTICLSR